MALTIDRRTAGDAWVARPNQALSPRLARTLVLSAAAITFCIALAFAAFGAWPVIPFAGLEVAALWLALRHLQRHADDEECIDIGEYEIVVTRRLAGRREEFRFWKNWARVRLEQPPELRRKCLFLSSHGRSLEIGMLLTDRQKQELAEEIRKHQGPR